MKVYEQIYAEVEKIPLGKVRSYGSIAAAIGKPRGARMIGWALKDLPPNTKIPWQRVVNRNGIISIKNPYHSGEQQANLLEAEGVPVKLCEDGWKVDRGF